MKNYPTWKPEANHRDRMLFDIGYSYALLHRCQHLLEILGDDFVDAAELAAMIKEFKDGRLQVRDVLYDNAEAAADLNDQLLALHRVIDAFDDFATLSEAQHGALVHAKKVTGHAEAQHEALVQAKKVTDHGLP